jgi:hypothetical protein
VRQFLRNSLLLPSGNFPLGSAVTPGLSGDRRHQPSLFMPFAGLAAGAGLQGKRSFECALKRFNPRHETGETPDNIRLWIAPIRAGPRARQTLLRPVYERLTEGLDAADLKMAKALLVELA